MANRSAFCSLIFASSAALRCISSSARALNSSAYCEPEDKLSVSGAALGDRDDCGVAPAFGGTTHSAASVSGPSRTRSGTPLRPMPHPLDPGEARRGRVRAAGPAGTGLSTDASQGCSWGLPTNRF